MSNAVKGFTLIELMMTLAIAALLLTVAVPSFQSFTQNSRLTKQVNLLAATISTARGEAAKRAVNVVVCQTNEPTAATPACNGTSGTWSDGWVVFADADGDAAVNAASDVVAAFQTESGVNLLTDAGTEVVFKPDGSTAEGTTVTFAICDSRGVNHGKKLDVATTGRASSSDATTCTP